MQMVARRDIAVDEELTYDYATSESLLESLDMNCLCGSANCRKRITGDDFKSAALRTTYEGHRLSYMDALLAASERNEQ
jgi:hypothetical protein